MSEERNQRARDIISSSRDGAAADASLLLPFPVEKLVDAITRLLGGAPSRDGAGAPTS